MPILGLILKILILISGLYSIFLTIPSVLISLFICCGDYTPPEIYLTLSIITFLIYAIIINYIINKIKASSRKNKKSKK